jgi:hypothetical protein
MASLVDICILIHPFCEFTHFGTIRPNFFLQKSKKVHRREGDAPFFSIGGWEWTDY